jgi:hypothetical protein
MLDYVWYSGTSTTSHIRTTYGDSDKAYTCIEIPFQGINQGNGAGPGIWLLVSIPIINMLKASGFWVQGTNSNFWQQIFFCVSTHL